MSNNVMPAVSRTQKSRIFEMVFRDKRELLGLYNAVNGTGYENPELLEINTLENAIYLSMHNDLSFIIDSRLTLYEHQSTYSPNLPLRYLLYVTDLYSSMTRDKNLYGTRLVMFPTPRFVIFYNGVAELPDVMELRLSDAFQVKEDECFLELRATLLNINPGHNQKLLKTCKTLEDYSRYSALVRNYAKTMELKAAVEKSIDECIRKDVLAEFLRKNRTEAIKVSIYEYDEERTMRQMREEGYEDGRQEERESAIQQGIVAIRKKKAKGRSVVAAADELELEADYIRRVYDYMDTHEDWSDLEIARQILSANHAE